MWLVRHKRRLSSLAEPGVVELDTLAGGQAIAPHLDRYPARVVAPKRNRCSIPGTNYEATQAAALRFVCLADTSVIGRVNSRCSAQAERRAHFLGFCRSVAATPPVAAAAPRGSWRSISSTSARASAMAARRCAICRHSASPHFMVDLSIKSPVIIQVCGPFDFIIRCMKPPIAHRQIECRLDFGFDFCGL